MNAKKRHHDLDTPLELLRGEWWDERKLEIADMGRKACEDALADLGVIKHDARGERTLLWLRYRLSYAGQIMFYQERALVPPQNIVLKANVLDVLDPAAGVPLGWVDIFRDARADSKDNAKMADALAGWEDRQDA